MGLFQGKSFWVFACLPACSLLHRDDSDRGQAQPSFWSMTWATEAVPSLTLRSSGTEGMTQETKTFSSVPPRTTGVSVGLSVFTGCNNRLRL